MEMQPVVSSNVQEVGYDESSQILHVRFLNGGLYEYRNVPLIEYESFVNAPSVGSYLHHNIKDVYPCERIG